MVTPEIMKTKKDNRKRLRKDEKLRRWELRRMLDEQKIDELNEQIRKAKESGDKEKAGQINRQKIKLQQKHAQQRFRENTSLEI